MIVAQIIKQISCILWNPQVKYPIRNNPDLSQTKQKQKTFFDVLLTGWQAEPATRIPPQSATPKLQHTSKQEHTTKVVIQYKSRRLLMMDVLMSETC